MSSFVASITLACFVFALSSVAHSGSGQWEFLSVITTAVGSINPFEFKIADVSVAPFANISVKLFCAVDITQCFGEGKEPTKTELDTMIQDWFDAGSPYFATSPQEADLRPVLKADGVNDFLSVLATESLDITTPPLALRARVRFDVAAIAYIHCRNDSAFGDEQYGTLYDSTNKQISYRINGAQRAISAPNSIQINEWYDIAAIWDENGKARIYINGIQSGSDGTYTGAVTSRQFINFLARSSSADGVTKTAYGNAQIANLTIYAGSKATWANIKKHITENSGRYGITIPA
jgi:hypothetical protein